MKHYGISHCRSLLILVVGILIWSCDRQASETDALPPPTKPKSPQVPAFNADTAYSYVVKQVAFGPRVLGSEGHAATQDWLVTKLRKTGAHIIEQDFTANVYTGESFAATNIIAQFNREASDRILLAAHWDTRHLADSPNNNERVEEPILGADDGGSGVAILLEVARQLQAKSVGLGVDIIFFDAEDYGESNSNNTESYCLGSQHWARNQHSPYRARYGILLDMVGAKDPKFLMEGYSLQINPELVKKVWTLAHHMGKGNYFIKQNGTSVTDDHVFVARYGKVPMIDIINLSGTQTTVFGAHWHTHNDNLEIIDKNTLRTVGQVLLAVIYREDAGVF